MAKGFLALHEIGAGAAFESMCSTSLSEPAWLYRRISNEKRPSVRFSFRDSVMRSGYTCRLQGTDAATEPLSDCIQYGYIAFWRENVALPCRGHFASAHFSKRKYSNVLTPAGLIHAQFT